MNTTTDMAENTPGTQIAEPQITAERVAAIQADSYLEGIHSSTRQVLDLKPGDEAILGVQPAVTRDYGFWLADLTIRTAAGETIQAPPSLIDKLSDRLYEVLSSVPHSKVLHTGEERKFGHGNITVPGAAPTRFGSWIELDTAALREWLISAEVEDDELHDSWGYGTALDARVADTLTDLIAELPETVLASAINALPSIDALHDADASDDPYVRVHVWLPGGHRLAGNAGPLKPFLNVNVDPADEHPAVTRAVKAIAAIVFDANVILDLFFARFQIRA